LIQPIEHTLESFCKRSVITSLISTLELSGNATSLPLLENAGSLEYAPLRTCKHDPQSASRGEIRQLLSLFFAQTSTSTQSGAKDNTGLHNCLGQRFITSKKVATSR
jgi:hypothetical protein